ncbi:hypothetical protein L6164_036316 [Bauhinia variegata]|uniref:Uncharacterized protein n=1 Tax=Bauhinia variegata TaxID=167791 RepID=A0ACB9KGT4_BAUVA|nr:hypothetical protein L6164_036316 [Bauhinia variegata]
MEEQTHRATARQTPPESEITQSDTLQHHHPSSSSHHPQPKLQSQRSINIQLPISHSQRSQVVQLPINQIYRFSPPQSQNETTTPENAEDQKPHPRFSFSVFLLWILLIIVLLLLLLCIMAIIFYLALRPKFPSFFIENFVVNYPQSQSYPLYNLSIDSKNPNSKISIYYLGGGNASLFYQKQAIAIGKPPPFYHHQKKTYHFSILLNSRDLLLPEEIEESIKGEKGNKVEIPLALLIRMPVKMKFLSLKMWKMAMKITCDVNVSMIVGESGLGSQNCRNKLLYTN